MEYLYEVPIVIKLYLDESEEDLLVKKSVTEFVSQHVPTSDWRDFFSEVGGVKVEVRKDRLWVTVSDDEPYSALNDDLHKNQLISWCMYGYFEGGLTLNGRYYGYPHEEIVVYLSDEKLPVLSKTKKPSMEKS